MKRTAAVAAILSVSAILGACSFSARTNHNYASEGGGAYAYTANPTSEQKAAGQPGTPVQFRYAGTINGLDVVLTGDNPGSIITCAKPCTTIRAMSLSNPGGPAQEKPYAEPKDGAGGLLDLVFDDIAYNKLTADPAATETAKTAMTAAPAAP